MEKVRERDIAFHRESQKAGCGCAVLLQPRKASFSTGFGCGIDERLPVRLPYCAVVHEKSKEDRGYPCVS